MLSCFIREKGCGMGMKICIAAKERYPDNMILKTLRVSSFLPR